MGKRSRSKIVVINCSPQMYPYPIPPVVQQQPYYYQPSPYYHNSSPQTYTVVQTPVGQQYYASPTTPASATVPPGTQYVHQTNTHIYNPQCTPQATLQASPHSSPANLGQHLDHDAQPAVANDPPWPQGFQPFELDSRESIPSIRVQSPTPPESTSSKSSVRSGTSRLSPLDLGQPPANQASPAQDTFGLRTPLIHTQTPSDIIEREMSRRELRCTNPDKPLPPPPAPQIYAPQPVRLTYAHAVPIPSHIHQKPPTPAASPPKQRKQTPQLTTPQPLNIKRPATPHNSHRRNAGTPESQTQTNSTSTQPLNTKRSSAPATPRPNPVTIEVQPQTNHSSQAHNIQRISSNAPRRHTSTPAASPRRNAETIEVQPQTIHSSPSHNIQRTSPTNSPRRRDAETLVDHQRTETIDPQHSNLLQHTTLYAPEAVLPAPNTSSVGPKVSFRRSPGMRVIYDPDHTTSSLMDNLSQPVTEMSNFSVDEERASATTQAGTLVTWSQPPATPYYRAPVISITLNDTSSVSSDSSSATGSDGGSSTTSYYKLRFPKKSERPSSKYHNGNYLPSPPSTPSPARRSASGSSKKSSSGDTACRKCGYHGEDVTSDVRSPKEPSTRTLKRKHGSTRLEVVCM